MPAAVQRADLFRVLVLLRRGGVYADADAACVAPLDALLQAEDTLVVGWENAFDTAEQAHARHYVRQRQARFRKRSYRATPAANLTATPALPGAELGVCGCAGASGAARRCVGHRGCCVGAGTVWRRRRRARLE